MQAQIHTVAFRGIETIDVTVQIHLGNGLPAMTIVGLADKAVAESRERVRAALSSLGLALPPKRIAINLAPADVVKEGAHFDLPIAAGSMVCCRQPWRRWRQGGIYCVRRRAGPRWHGPVTLPLSRCLA